MNDLNIIDSSIKLFSIDKPHLVFQISKNDININNQNNNNISISSTNPINLGQTSLIVSNLSSEYLSFRTKSTKKKYYSVYPSYCVISPNQKIKIDFRYFIKEGEKVSNEGHKFKFEAFVIPPEEKDKDAKILFNTYISQKTPVKATVIKSGVKFIEKENMDIQNTNIKNPLSSNSIGILSEKSIVHSEDSVLSKEDPLIVSNTIDKNKVIEKINEKNKNFDLHNDFGTPKVKKYSNSSKKLYDLNAPKTEEENIALLNNLKVEYFKLKNELDILKNNYYNLRNHVDLEENEQEEPKKENKKDKYPSINSKEIKLSPLICGILFIFGIILGFYLS